MGGRCRECGVVSSWMEQPNISRAESATLMNVAVVLMHTPCDRKPVFSLTKKSPSANLDKMATDSFPAVQCMGGLCRECGVVWRTSAGWWWGR